MIAEVGEQLRALGRQTLVEMSDVSDRESVRKLRDAVLGAVRTCRYFGERSRTDVSQTKYRCRRCGLGGTFRNESHRSAAYLSGVLLPLKASGAGRVINIASLGSFVAFHEVAAYCASKAAVLSLTRSFACEWAHDGICVNAIAPGVFPTELNAHLLQGTERGREILQRHSDERFGDPRELIGAAVLLASDGASFMTGHCLSGGWRISCLGSEFMKFASGCRHACFSLRGRRPAKTLGCDTSRSDRPNQSHC